MRYQVIFGEEMEAEEIIFFWRHAEDQYGYSLAEWLENQAVDWVEGFDLSTVNFEAMAEEILDEAGRCYCCGEKREDGERGSFCSQKCEEEWAEEEEGAEATKVETIKSIKLDRDDYLIISEDEDGYYYCFESAINGVWAESDDIGPFASIEEAEEEARIEAMRRRADIAREARIAEMMEEEEGRA